MLNDGLAEICHMINSSNHYYRGQAFEILLSITDCDTFDWFQPHDGNLTVRILHSKLLSMSKNIFFLSGLLENRKDSYPGGSFRALQLLAFWLSWVRAMMTENQILNLSSRTLVELKLWAMGNGPRNDKGVGTDIVESVDDEDEIKLAKTLYKDFSYEQFHRESSGDVYAVSEDNLMNSVSNLSIQTHTAVSFTDEERAAIFVSGFDESAMHFSNSSNSNSSSTHTQLDQNEDPFVTTHGMPGSYIDVVDKKCNAACFTGTGTGAGNSPHEDGDVERARRAPEEPYNRVKYVEASIQEARSLKEEGNRYFKLSQYTYCVTPYENAIAEIESGLEVCQIQTSDKLLSDEVVQSLLTLKIECDELLASLHFNKATAYWKLSELDAAPHTSAEQHSNSVQTYLDLCKSYCTIAISINPRHSKSVYRLCEAFMRQNKSAEALRVIEEHSKLCPLDDLLRNLRRKCLAAFLSIQGPDEDPDLISTSPLTSSSTFSPKSSVSKTGRSPFKESAYIESESLCEITNAAIENYFVTEDIQRTDDNARTGTSVHGGRGADVVVNTVGNRAAKVLKQLQARAGREKSRNDHAYNGFLVPLESDTQVDVAPKDFDSTDIATNGKKETLHISVIDSDGDSVERSFNHSKEIESDRRMRKKLSKIQVSTISNDKNKHKKKVKKEKGSINNLIDREEMRRKSKDKHRGADKGEVEGGGGVCKTDGECAKNRDGSHGVAESLHKLRKLSILFDITFDKALAASNTTSKKCKTTSKGSSTVPSHDRGNDMGSRKVEDEGDIVINNDISKGGGRAEGETQTQHADNGQEDEDSLDPILIGLFDALDAQVHSAVEVRSDIA